MAIKVRPGIENLEAVDKVLKNRRVGLITGSTGLDTSFRSTVDILREKYNLVRLFSPEHGVRGERQAGEEVDSYIDEQTSLEVASLYGRNRDNEALVRDIDVVVLDIQDVGARFYTYLYTMTGAMQRCAEHDIPFVVLDRMNPLGLTRTEGTLLNEKYSSFVGKYAVPTRYALTIGEFARYINEVKGFGCELSIAPCTNLTRDIDYADTDLLWVSPSPNMPSLDAACCYIGTALFEGTNLSEGRGTTHPFEFIGAPWFDAQHIIPEMSALGLPGVAFREAYFTPSFSKHEGKLCRGVQLHITDRKVCEPFRTALLLLGSVRRHCPEFEFLPPSASGHPFIDLISGTDELRSPAFDAEAFLKRQRELTDQWQAQSRFCHLYN